MEGANVFGDLSSERIKPIEKSRQLAHNSLRDGSAAFERPNIAGPLEWSRYSIAIVRVTSVQSPADAAWRTKIGFHVERLLRGDAEKADFEIESQWSPMLPPKNDRNVVFAGEERLTVLDRSEPRLGDQYILGYSIANGEGDLMFAPGVIDLQAPGQAQLRADVERFLTIDSEASRSGPRALLDAMNDNVSWIRDIAVHRFTSSTACNASPNCSLRFQATVKRYLQSELASERQNAIFWLVWVDSVSRNSGKDRPDGLPILPDSVIRSLLSAAVQDPNVLLGDSAFEYREMFDMNRTAPAGECFEIVPALRASAHWLEGEHNILPPAFPLSYSFGCIPAR